MATRKAASAAKSTTTTKKGKRLPRAKAGVTAARVEILRAQALKMLQSGASCPEIGTALGVTRQRAWQLATEALDELKAETLEDAARWRVLLTAEHQEQLKAARSLRDEVDPETSAAGISKAHATLVELAKLWGASAPAQTAVALTGKDGGPIQTQAVPADLSKLSDEQLAALETLLKIATPPAGE